MQRPWYLCEIEKYPKHEGEELKKANNLSVKYPDIFEGGWLVWLPIIPRVGDTLQFSGWQVQVSRVVLRTDWYNKAGPQKEPFVSAIISIHDNAVPDLLDSHFAIEALNSKTPYKWENYARRGHDLQYYAWELRHEAYLLDTSNLYFPDTQSAEDMEKKVYYRWHTRIRPVTGDIIKVENNRWRVMSVELASANSSVDGWLTLEAVV